jgi:ribosome-associated heat shock protein Hsp15
MTESFKASVRLDRWLWAARAFKTRGLAQEACSKGQVKLNDHTAKPSAPVRVGDELSVTKRDQKLVWHVQALSEKRGSATLAQQLYEDHSPPPPPKAPDFAVRERGAGRPTKGDRRALRRLKRRD